MATKPSHVLFDIFDTSWKCKKCGTVWYSSDGWMEIGNLLIPHKSRNSFKRENGGDCLEKKGIYVQRRW